MTPAKLSELIEAVEMASPEGESSAYLDRQTRRVIWIDQDIVHAIESDDPERIDEMPDWQKETIEDTRMVLDGEEGRFIELPDQFDFNEYESMQRFCLNQENDDLREELLRVIRGSGAFRRFKDAIARRGVEKEWYCYRDHALREFVAAWCDAEGVAYVDDQKKLT